jgi:small subunit ribosomal protein S5
MSALSQLRTHKSASRERGISLEQLYSWKLWLQH